MNRLNVMLLSLCLTCVPSFAQSGRKKATPATTPKVESSTSTPNDITVEGSDSTAPSGGETVDEDVVRVDTALVTVPVTVADRYGKYVPNLRREDFHLYEEGVEQKIAYFASVNQPFTVILVIDTSGSTRFRLEDIQDAAINFVGRLKDNDSVMVMSFDDRIQVLTPPTSDREAVMRAIRRTHTGGGTRLYDAVDEILKKHLASISGRKAVVLFTDGVDTTSHASFNGTLHAAGESDAPFYSVDYDTSGTIMGMGQGLPIPGTRGGILIGVPFPGGRGGGPSTGSSPSDYRRANEYLHEISETTGGRFYSADSLVGISQAFEWIADELRRQYSLGYYPKSADATSQSGQRRQIKVKVNQSDLVVKARDSYIYSDKKKIQSSSDKQPYIADLPTGSHR